MKESKDVKKKTTPKKEKSTKLQAAQEEFSKINIDEVLDEIDNTLGDQASSSFGPAYKTALQSLMEKKYEFGTQRGTWSRVSESFSLVLFELSSTLKTKLSLLRKKITKK